MSISFYLELSIVTIPSCSLLTIPQFGQRPIMSGSIFQIRYFNSYNSSWKFISMIQYVSRKKFSRQRREQGISQKSKLENNLEDKIFVVIWSILRRVRKF